MEEENNLPKERSFNTECSNYRPTCPDEILGNYRNPKLSLLLTIKLCSEMVMGHDIMSKSMENEFFTNEDLHPQKLA